MLSRIVKSSLTWLAIWAAYAVAIIAIGSILGALLGPIVGLIMNQEYTFTGYMLKGLSIGARYAGVWAGGTAIVLCVLHANRKRSA